MLDNNSKSEAMKVIDSMFLTPDEKDYAMKFANVLIEKAVEAARAVPAGYSPLVIPIALAAATYYVKNTTPDDDGKR